MVLLGDALEQLRTLETESVHTCVTSPPYYNLRDYGTAGQIGVETTPEEYIDNLVAVFREVRRILRQDGTATRQKRDSMHQICQKGTSAENRQEEHRKGTSTKT